MKIDDQNYQLEIPEVDIEDIAEYKVKLLCSEFSFALQ